MLQTASLQSGCRADGPQASSCRRFQAAILIAPVHSPVLPSQKRTFTRFLHRLQNKTTWPLRGSSPSRSRTNPCKPSKPPRSPLEAFTQIGRSCCQVDPGRGSKPKHKPMLFPKRRSVVLMSPNRNPAALRYSARHRALLPSIQRMLAGLRALRIRECCSQSARSSAAP